MKVNEIPAMIGHLVHYPKSKWDRGGAWANLLRQQIPGCPKPLIIRSNGEQVWGHGWRKEHTKDTWCWRYYGAPRQKDEIIDFYPWEIPD